MSVHALGFRDYHRPPYGPPLTALAHENENVSACVVELLAAHFIRDLVRISRNRRITENIDSRIIDFEIPNLSLFAKILIAGYACVYAFRALGEIRMHHNNVLAKE